VDIFGDNLMSVTNIPGDSFRIRHDKSKSVLNRFFLSCNIRAECEVFGVFKDLIPSEALEVEGEDKDGRDSFQTSDLSYHLQWDSRSFNLQNSKLLDSVSKEWSLCEEEERWREEEIC